MKNAIASGAASFLALLAMALWFGGTQEFVTIVSSFMFWFLVISFLAFLLGACFNSNRLRWSVLAGAVSGIVAACVIALVAMSRI